MDEPAPPPATAGPEGMRQLVRDYVWTVHATYLDHVRHLPPGVRGSLPLLSAGHVTVAAAAARRLHLVAVTTTLPGGADHEVAITDEHDGTSWTTRFYDPSVLPGLGLLVEDSPADVRRVLGVGETVYHLTVEPGGGLDAHHAQHSGVALANQHARTVRQLDRLRQALPHRADVVDELGTCAALGLDRAAALLARELTSGRVDPAPGAPASDVLDAVVEDVRLINTPIAVLIGIDQVRQAAPVDVIRDGAVERRPFQGRRAGEGQRVVERLVVENLEQR